MPSRRGEMGSKPWKRSVKSEGWGTASALIIRRRARPVGIEETLQNQHRSHLIDHFPAP